MRSTEERAAYPPLQSVDEDVVGFVGDVESHQTEVGEIPEELWKEENQVKNQMSDLCLFPSL